MNKKYVLMLSAEERSELGAVARKGSDKVARRRRARALLLTDQGEEGPAWPDEDVAEAVGVTSRSIENWRKRACEEGPRVAQPVRLPARFRIPSTLEAHREAHLDIPCSRPDDYRHKPGTSLSHGASSPVDDVNASDQILIDRCLAGQTDAFGELVTRYQDRLYGTLVNMLGSVHDARDASQDAFVLAFEKLSTFRRESAFYSWLFRIAYNAAVSRHRKTRRVTSSVDAARDASGTEPTDDRPEADPAHNMDTTERQSLVQSALQELADEYRTAIILREMEGMSYEEIADVVNCPVGTVRSRIHRARSELREKLTRAMAGER